MEMLLNITQIFQIAGRGWVVCGKACPGAVVKAGSEVMVVRGGAVVLSAAVGGLGMLHYTDAAAARANESLVDVLLKGVNKEAIRIGDMVYANGKHPDPH